MLHLIHKLQYPVERGIAATQDDQLLTGKLRRITHPIMQGGVCVFVGIWQPEGARLKRPDATSDHNCFCVEGIAT